MPSKEILQSPDQLQLPILYDVTDKPFVKGTSHYYQNQLKATNEQLIESYSRLRNIWNVAREFGMCGQSVHQRLSKLGLCNHINKMTNQEICRIKEVYESGIVSGDGKLQKLSKEINRTIPFISRFAKRMGLTSYCRKKSENLKREISIRATEWIKMNGHPKGFLNHTHSHENRSIISASAVRKWETITELELYKRAKKCHDTTLRNGHRLGNIHGDGSKPWKAQWATIGQHTHYYRSQWEVNYAKYLEGLKINGEIVSWIPEPDIFWFNKIKSKVRSYKPDFKIIDNNGEISYHEIKGWMDKRSMTSIQLMKECYPEINLLIIDSFKYKKLFK